MSFSVSVEQPSKVSRKLTIKVPADTVENRFMRGLETVRQTAEIKGFRKGMVPMNLIKQMYGQDVRHRLFHDLIEEFYGQALKEQKIRAVSAPKIETPDHQHGAGAHDHGVQEGKDLTFTATVEILPEIEVKNYNGIALTRSKAVLTDKDFEDTLTNLLNSRAELVPATGGLVGADGAATSRPVRKGDFVDLNFDGGLVTDNGVEKQEGMKGQRMLEVGSNSLIPGFEENLEGMRSGESKTFRIDFPKDYHATEMAGKTAEFHVSVGEVKEKKLPELNDDFAKDLGYENVAEMKAKAREHMEREKKDEAERKLRSDLLQQLIERNTFEVPAALIQAQTRRLAQEVAQNLKQQGFTEEMLQEAIQAELENLKKRAENQVRSSLLLEAVAKAEKISITAADLDAEVAKMATQMNVEPEKVREYYLSNADRREDFEYKLREDRAVAFLLEKAKIKDEK